MKFKLDDDYKYGTATFFEKLMENGFGYTNRDESFSYHAKLINIFLQFT